MDLIYEMVYIYIMIDFIKRVQSYEKNRIIKIILLVI